ARGLSRRRSGPPHRGDRVRSLRLAVSARAAGAAGRVRSARAARRELKPEAGPRSPPFRVSGGGVRAAAPDRGADCGTPQPARGGGAPRAELLPAAPPPEEARDPARAG